MNMYYQAPQQQAAQYYGQLNMQNPPPPQPTWTDGVITRYPYLDQWIDPVAHHLIRLLNDPNGTHAGRQGLNAFLSQNGYKNPTFYELVDLGIKCLHAFVTHDGLPPHQVFELAIQQAYNYHLAGYVLSNRMMQQQVGAQKVAELQQVFQELESWMPEVYQLYTGQPSQPMYGEPQGYTQPGYSTYGQQPPRGPAQPMQVVYQPEPNPWADPRQGGVYPTPRPTGVLPTSQQQQQQPVGQPVRVSTAWKQRMEDQTAKSGGTNMTPGTRGNPALRDMAMKPEFLAQFGENIVREVKPNEGIVRQQGSIGTPDMLGNVFVPRFRLGKETPETPQETPQPQNFTPWIKQQHQTGGGMQQDDHSVVYDNEPVDASGRRWAPVQPPQPAKTPPVTTATPPAVDTMSAIMRMSLNGDDTAMAIYNPMVIPVLYSDGPFVKSCKDELYLVDMAKEVQLIPANISPWEPHERLTEDERDFDPETHILMHALRRDRTVYEAVYEKKRINMKYCEQELDPELRHAHEERERQSIIAPNVSALSQFQNLQAEPEVVEVVDPEVNILNATLRQTDDGTAVFTDLHILAGSEEEAAIVMSREIIKAEIEDELLTRPYDYEYELVQSFFTGVTTPRPLAVQVQELWAIRNMVSYAQKLNALKATTFPKQLLHHLNDIATRELNTVIAEISDTTDGIIRVGNFMEDIGDLFEYATNKYGQELGQAYMNKLQDQYGHRIITGNSTIASEHDLPRIYKKFDYADSPSLRERAVFLIERHRVLNVPHSSTKLFMGETPVPESDIKSQDKKWYELGHFIEPVQKTVHVWFNRMEKETGQVPRYTYTSTCVQTLDARQFPVAQNANNKRDLWVRTGY